MLVISDGAAAPNACPVDDRSEDADAKGWEAWRKGFEHWRRVKSVVSDDTGVIVVRFYSWVNAAETDYLKLVFRPDDSDRTGWSFECWKEGEVFFTS
jgi:hypothetical protein